MAKIESYPLAPSPVSGNDKLIGTDTANNNATKNFTVNQLISFIGLNGGFVPYTGAIADINLGNRGIFGSVGVFSSLVQASNVNVLGGLLINSSAGTSGQVLVSQGSGNRPIWSSSVVTGAQGIQGPIGPQGPVGPVGPAGLNWRSSWVSGTSYIVDDAVGYGGASWFCILATSGTTTPDLDTTHWALLASQGAQGPAGATGAQGPTGATGATGATGPTGTQTLQQVLDFNHDLTNGNNYQGTVAGLSNTGINVNALGEGSAQNNTVNNINALGYQAALNNIGRNLNALGYQAGLGNSGVYVNAFGINSAVSNIGVSVNAFGNSAGLNNTYNSVNLFGNSSSATADNQTVFAHGSGFKARLGYGGITADRLYTFPDKSGTFAMLSDLAGGGSWSTLGNLGTNASVNFIGTTDNVDVVIKRNNAEKLKISSGNALFSTNITSIQGYSTYITAQANVGSQGISLAYDPDESTVAGILAFSGATTYSRLKADDITADRIWQMPNESGTLALESYKVYTALLSYSGSSPLTAIVLKNTIGVTINWNKVIGSALFRGTTSSGTPFTANKTFITTVSYNDSGIPYFAIANPTSFQPTVSIDIAMFLYDGTSSGVPQITNMPIEIRVYP